MRQAPVAPWYQRKSYPSGGNWVKIGVWWISAFLSIPQAYGDIPKQTDPFRGPPDPDKSSLFGHIIDHGVVGELFPVAEEDLRDVFKAKLKHLTDTGRMAEIAAEFKTKAESALTKPQAVAGLTPTVEERTFTHDPTHVIDTDIVDHQSTILARAGERINPLDHIKLSKGLLFIDGDIPAQVAWGQEHSDAYYIILVNGAPLELGTYFDQGGIITTHYGIRQIPAKIEPQGKLLHITEYGYAADWHNH